MISAPTMGWQRRYAPDNSLSSGLRNFIYRLAHSAPAWLVRKLAWRFGYDICCWPNLRAILADCDLVIDAGGGLGQSRDLFRMLGYRGRVVSFEAKPESYEELKSARSFFDPDEPWEIRPDCLSDRSCRRKFHVQPGEHSGLDRSKPGCGCIEVQTRRLDEIFAKEKARKILLKTDCEGHDLSVVRGAEGLHGRITHVMMEVGRCSGGGSELNFDQTIYHMRRMGFTVACFIGNIFAAGNRRAEAFDILFERTG